MTAKRILTYASLALLMMAGAITANADSRHTVKRGETIFGIAHRYGVTPDAIIAVNPQAANGVKKDMVLIIPDGVEEETTVTETPVQQTKEEKKKKEKDNKKKGDQAEVSEPAVTTPVVTTPVVTTPVRETITTPKEQDKSADQSAAQQSQRRLISYLSKPGDTFASISERTGVSEDTLIELNPFVDPIRIPSGTQIRLSDEAPYGNVYPESQPSSDDQPYTIPTIPTPTSPIDGEYSDYDPVLVPEYDAAEHRNVMLLLPFMAEENAQSRSAKQYADFYRGFLIAAQQFNNSGPYDVEVIALDTEGQTSKIQSQLANTRDRDLAIIIAPEDERQLDAVIDAATSQDVYVFNIFDFKSEKYKTNPYVIQGNINQSLMYQKAIQALSAHFEDYIPVILSPTNAKEEKAPFIAAVRQHYIEMGVEPIDIEFDDALTERDLDVLEPELKYVFLYKSGSQSAFNRAALTLLNVISEEGYNGRFGVFGYPDWTMFRNESLAHLHQLGAVIYSRFDFGADSAGMKELQDKFQRWYGQAMLEAFPSQGALGYDVGAFLLSTLQQGSFKEQLEDGAVFQGVQSTFNLVQDNSKGYVNNALYIIQYRPDGSYTVKVL
ncbi:MAG: LysM peptidoglycan-binding domain-containing protein [Bacteroidales bacterium]|nr:LysM peptidoglycan-binding domain-containing protein [Bacteroidales bacterium]